MRMRQHLGEGADPAVGGISASYAYAVGSGDDPSTWRDEELAQIFRNMRLAMKVSRETIARRLATSVASVETFESRRRGRVTSRQGDRADCARVSASFCGWTPSPFFGVFAVTCRPLQDKPGPASRQLHPASFLERSTLGVRALHARNPGSKPNDQVPARPASTPSPAPASTAPCTGTVRAERPSCTRGRAGLSGARVAVARVSSRGPVAGFHSYYSAYRHGLSGRPHCAAPRRIEVDRGQRSPRPQGRQDADRDPLALQVSRRAPALRAVGLRFHPACPACLPMAAVIPAEKLDKLVAALEFAPVRAERKRQPGNPCAARKGILRSLNPVVETIREYAQGRGRRSELKALSDDTSADKELQGDGVRGTRPGRRPQGKPPGAELRVHLLPKDAADEKSAILEVRAGTGGDEAALFAADLFRMYSRYAEQRGWKTEIISLRRTIWAASRRS